MVVACPLVDIWIFSGVGAGDGGENLHIVHPICMQMYLFCGPLHRVRYTSQVSVLESCRVGRA
jgi:hypothetical protein